jgi:negative regulator of flagellin synthesis FlgM
VDPKPQYDSVTISEQTEESTFRKELVSRLSNEIRTATSTGDIQDLKQKVAQGQYTVDAMRVAGRIMWLDDEGGK